MYLLTFVILMLPSSVREIFKKRSLKEIHFITEYFFKTFISILEWRKIPKKNYQKFTRRYLIDTKVFQKSKKKMKEWKIHSRKSFKNNSKIEKCARIFFEEKNREVCILVCIKQKSEKLSSLNIKVTKRIKFSIKKN